MDFPTHLPIDIADNEEQVRFKRFYNDLMVAKTDFEKSTLVLWYSYRNVDAAVKSAIVRLLDIDKFNRVDVPELTDVQYKELISLNVVEPYRGIMEERFDDSTYYSIRKSEAFLLRSVFSL